MLLKSAKYWRGKVIRIIFRFSDVLPLIFPYEIKFTTFFIGKIFLLFIFAWWTPGFSVPRTARTDNTSLLVTHNFVINFFLCTEFNFHKIFYRDFFYYGDFDDWNFLQDYIFVFFPKRWIGVENFRIVWLVLFLSYRHTFHILSIWEKKSRSYANYFAHRKIWNG